MTAFFNPCRQSCSQLSAFLFLPKQKVFKQLLLLSTFLVFSMSYGQTPTFCEDMAGSSCSSCPTFTVTDNPDLGVSCQETIDVILILDESNSIGTANAQNQVRDGVLAFLQELECSPVNVAIIEFGSVANYVVSTYTPTANVRTGMTNYFAGTAYNGQTYNPSQGNLGGTNWQAALLRANALPAADLLLMFTDGQPTTYTPDHTLPGSSYDFCGDGASTQPAETYNAAVLANVIKGKGTHMFVLGVGNAIAGSIPSISGNDVYNSSINSIATSDYEIDANINNIAACFRNLAKSLCPIIVDIDGSSICEDASNGTIDVSLATLATGPFTVTVRQGTTTVQSFITPSKDFTISNLVAGNYNVRVQANGTCYTDGNANTTVSTIVTEPIITNITICSDESYEWPANDITYLGTGGSTSVTIVGQGCDADQILNLTVTQEPTPIITNETICSDESFVWTENGLTYNGADGAVSVTLEGEDCAADRVLNLIVNPEPEVVTTTANICSDEEYTWSVNGVTYTTAQDITIEGEDCAADQRLVLTINPEPEVVTTTASICSDEEYTWSVNGVTYTTAKDITMEGEDCVSDQRLVLTINAEPEVVTTNASICSDEEYTWSVNGVTYSTAQDITIEGEDCAADQRLVLTINEEPAPVVTEVNICSDEEYTWSVNGVTYTTAQDITIEGEDCAADQRLVLTINPEPEVVTTTANICSDEEYTWSVNGVTYTTAQNITIEGEDCAADQRLMLTINPEPEVVTTTANICSDEEYTWLVNGVTYTTAQDITIEGEDCAADQRLVLTINPEPEVVTTTANICSDEEYTWSVNGVTYTTAQDITIEGEDCAADQRLVLTINPEPEVVTTTANICSDEEYTWSVNGVTYTTAQNITIEGEDCAADQRLVLTINPEPEVVTTTANICSDEEYTWSVNGVTYTTAQNITIEGEDCAADQRLVLTINPEPEVVTTTANICSDEEYTWSVNGVTYATAQDITIEGEDCAADQRLVLTINEEPAPVVTEVNICSDEEYTWSVNGVTYTTAQDITIEGEDCAADQRLVLTINEEPAPVVTEVNICSDEEYTWSVNGVTYTTAQDITIEGEDCAADQRLVLTINEEPAPVVTEVNICSDEEYTWSVNGVTYTTAQDINIEGEDCAADQRLVLTINPEPEVVTTTANICSDEEYTWSVNGVTYTTAQDITIEGEDCAADQRLVLTINEEPAPIVTEVNICSDEEYTWSVNGVTYTTAQDITIEGEDCAADQRLVLTINPEPEVVTTTANICSDEEYTWSVNGVTYTTAQDITIEGEDCAADQRLILTVNPLPTIVVRSTECNEESQLGFYAVNVSVNGGIVTSNLGNPVDNGSDSWTISGIPAISNVIITVTASSGCTNSIEVQAPACNKKCVELEVKHINVSCYGLNDGHIFVDFVTEGAIVYVNNELYDPNAFYAPGIYTVWAFFEGADDDKECDVKVYVEITQPVSVDFDVTYTDVTCEGENNGTITVSNLSEGANYTIQLDGAGPDLSGQIYFEPGMYYILASLDASPCTKGYFITIEEPKKLFCEIMMDFNMDNLRCRATIFSYLTAVATDGTGELSYAWEISTSRNGWSIISDPNEATIHFKPGVGRATFIVTITDENGCQTQCSREVTSTCTRGQGVTLSPTFAARNGNSDPYNVQLYPNPVKNKLNIKFEEEVSSDISVEVFDLVGSVVYKNVFSPSQIDNMTIDFSKFKSQVYYVKFTTVEGVIIKQVVLDK